MNNELNQNATIEIITWCVVIIPLLSFFISFFIKEKYNKAISITSTALLFINTILCCLLFYNVWHTQAYLIKVDWFSLANYPISVDILLTDQSVIMLGLVSVISFLVHLYSIGYMAEANGLQRYFGMLGFFTFAMQGIVLSDNLLLIFVFWELVGFSSYMLIGHQMHKLEASKAATKAFLINRIGDIGFIIGIMIIWVNTNTFDLSIILATDFASWKTVASICIFFGVIGKSAQFPLFPWLPDAMHGPTPVSALMHAATMVVAGVYLMLKTYLLFPANVLMFVTAIGLITALMGSLAALSQYDIKKILAYSTISQLGLMVTAIGTGAPNAAMLHLFTHAFFKACLFLCAGSIIHSMNNAQQNQPHLDVQDIRNLGGLRNKMPLTFISCLISAASLAGLPFFSGFLSKEAILLSISKQHPVMYWICIVVFMLVIAATVLYTFRLIWFVFIVPERKPASFAIKEAPMNMIIPMVMLAIASLWFVISWNPFGLKGWIVNFNLHGNIELQIFSVIWILLSLIVSYIIFNKKNLTTHKILLNGFYIDSISKRIFKSTAFTLSTTASYVDSKVIDPFIYGIAYTQVTIAHIIAWTDRYLIDGIVHGFTSIIAVTGKLIKSFQNGKIQLYIFWAIFAAIIFLIWALVK